MFSEGKVVSVPVPNRTPDRSNYTAVYGPAGCTSCGAHSVRVDAQGNIWLVDAPQHLVYKMDPQGKDVLMRLGRKGVAGTGHNDFNLPTDVAFASNGDIYVSDGYGGARVVPVLRSIRGVGEVLALTWALEVGDPQRFPSVGDAVSYCGKGGLWDIGSQSCPTAQRFVSDPPAVPRLGTNCTK